MKSKTDLFRLIRSMSRSEKRYFALDAQKAGKKNAKYVTLFKLINGMDVYDEAKVKAKFPKHLSVDKAYLYDAILRSMRDYHSKKSRAAQVKEKVLDAKYLYERELYDLCEESLSEAKALAEELGDHLALLEINKQERRLVRSAKKKELPTHVPVLVEAKEKYLQALQEEMAYLDLYDEIAKRFIERKKPDDKFTQRLNCLLGRDETKLISILAKHRFYQCKGLQHQMLGDFDTVFDYYNKAIDWWDNNPKYKEEEFYNYVIDVYNFLGICLRKEQYELMNGLVNRLSEETPNNPHHQKVLFQCLYQFKLTYNINNGIIDKVDELSEEVNKGLNSFTLSFGGQSVLVANVAVLFFLSGKFQDCTNWCNKILRSKTTTPYLEINRALFFLKIVATYEKNEIDELDNTMRATQRFLIKSEKHRENYYISLLKSFKALVNTPPSLINKALGDLEKQVNLFKRNKIQREPLGLDSLIMYWIESKKNKLPIADVIKLTKIK